MEGLVKSFWEFFTPPDPPLTDFYPKIDIQKAEAHMKAYRNWSMKVSGTLALFSVGIVFACFTPWGFVRASDLDQKLNAAVQKTVAAIIKDQELAKAQNNQMAKAINEILRSQTANTICRILNTKVDTESARAQRRSDADSEQEKYREITGDYYPESRCGSAF